MKSVRQGETTGSLSREAPRETRAFTSCLSKLPAKISKHDPEERQHHDREGDDD